MAVRQRQTISGQDLSACLGAVLVCRSWRAALLLCFFTPSPQALAWATRPRERGGADARFRGRSWSFCSAALSAGCCSSSSLSSAALLPALPPLARLQSCAILSLRSSTRNVWPWLRFASAGWAALLCSGLRRGFPAVLGVGGVSRRRFLAGRSGPAIWPDEGSESGSGEAGC